MVIFGAENENENEFWSVSTMEYQITNHVH